jgi:hypothetical protein
VTRIRASVLVVALSLGGLAAGMVGPASAGAASRDHNLKLFRSPTGNIGCEMVKSDVRCDIESRDWKPPPAPSNCGLDYGQGLAVGRHGKGYFVCAGDTALDPDAKALGYGHSIRFGPMGCKSKTTGMTCKNHATGHGFFLSTQSYRRF